jgi:hypothetical protein
MQWSNELRRNVRLHPSCKLLRELLSLDLYTRTAVYPFLIKGWSSRRIADRLKVSLITIQKLLEIGREQLKRKLAAPGESYTERETQDYKSGPRGGSPMSWQEPWEISLD